MGQFVSKRAEWRGDSLKQTTDNEAMLSAVHRAITELAEEYPEEAQTPFAAAFQFFTALTPSDVRRSPFASEFHTDEDDVVSSRQTLGPNRPIYQIYKFQQDKYMVSVKNVYFLQRHLALAGTRALVELQALIEENRDPVRFVSGVEAEPKDVLRVGYAQLATKTGSEAEELSARMQLLLVINEKDLALMSHVVEAATGAAKELTLARVEDEVAMLRRYCGDQPTDVLRALQLVSDFRFSGAVRVPPWREVEGEIAYIVAHPHDGGGGEGDSNQIVVTATLNGFCTNGGYVVNQRGESELDYTYTSELFPSLVELFRATSDHFARHIDSQQFVFETRDQAAARGGGQGGSGGKGQTGRRTSGAGTKRKPSSGGGGGGGGGDGGRVTRSRSGRTASARKRPGSTRAGRGGGGGGGKKKKAYLPREPNMERSLPPSAMWRNIEREIDAEVEDDRRGRRRRPEHHIATVSTVTGAINPGSTSLRAGRKRRRGGGSGKKTTRFVVDGTAKAGSRRKRKAGAGAKAKASAGPVQKAAVVDIYTDEDSSEDDMVEVPAFHTPVGDEWREWDKIKTLIQTIQVANQTATILCLVHLLDCDLAAPIAHDAFIKFGGMQMLVNLLSCDDRKCRIGALKVLRALVSAPYMQAYMEQLNGIPPLCDLVRDRSDEVRCLAAETLGKCAEYSRCRRAVRQYGGIPWLVAMLPITDFDAQLNLAHSAADALWSISRSRKNKVAIRNAGILLRIEHILSVDEEGRPLVSSEAVLVPLVGILYECAKIEAFRADVVDSDVVVRLVDYLRVGSRPLLIQCAKAIFEFAAEADIQMLVYNTGDGIENLVRLLTTNVDAEMMVAVSGALWKCAGAPENVATLQDEKAIRVFVDKLRSGTEEVQVNVAGALHNCAKVGGMPGEIKRQGGIVALVEKLKESNPQLLVNVAGTIGACATDAACLADIKFHNGLQYLWSLLKSPHHEVVAAAAWAIRPCISDGIEAGNEIRSFVGGLELVVSLLETEDDDVRAAVCATIANIAMHPNNLGVISDHGAIPMLASLTNTTNARLRKTLADAIAMCCAWADNRDIFGKAGAVAPLVDYLRAPNAEVHVSTAAALHALSGDAKNCITMHEAGVVELLLDMMAADDPDLQMSAAGCLSNIRLLALANERSKVA